LQLCLKEFNNDPEAVINRVLEDSLPPNLKGLDFNLPATDKATPHVPPKLEAKEEVGLLLDQREGAFDYDEFDVLRRPEAVDLSRVHIGKKLVMGYVKSL
jgi:hypothetical protein